ncbi:MAG: RteC domain-containing protein [Alistipes sp.]|nr:RteC domain-containing protein [Alistipes sp.]
MIDFTKQLQREINRKIDKIERSDKNPIKKASEASHVLGEGFQKLKAFVIDYSFRDETEEIDFFKDNKPRFCSRLIYYRKLYNIEMNRPVASIEVQMEYLNTELEAINLYNSKRLDFIRYYRSGATHLDSLYFLRNQADTDQYLETFYYERDPQFSTTCDFKVAKILANDMLWAYLMTEIEKLDADTGRRGGVGFPMPETRITWQDKKSILLELIYAWDSKECFGNVTLTQLASYISNVFNVQLDVGNLSRAFCDMKLRNDPAPGLGELEEALLKRMKRTKKKRGVKMGK